MAQFLVRVVKEGQADTLAVYEKAERKAALASAKEALAAGATVDVWQGTKLVLQQTNNIKIKFMKPAKEEPAPAPEAV
jgi:hypothetical protein